MLHQLLPTMLAAMMIIAGPNARATAGDAPCDACTPVCATCGEKVCITCAQPGKETKHCWEVECVEVCIPAVRFPWEHWKKNHCDDCCDECCPPKHGKVRSVKKLKKVEYECDVCEYEHKIVCRCPHCGPISCDACLPSSGWFHAPVEENVDEYAEPAAPVRLPAEPGQSPAIDAPAVPEESAPLPPGLSPSPVRR